MSGKPRFIQSQLPKYAEPPKPYITASLEDWYDFFYKSKDEENLALQFEHVKFYMRFMYGFLQKDQIMGRSYDYLKIPNVMGKINKSKFWKMVQEEKASRKRKLKIEITKAAGEKRTEFKKLKITEDIDDPEDPVKEREADPRGFNESDLSAGANHKANTANESKNEDKNPSDKTDDLLSSKNDYDTGMVSPSNSFVELLAKSDDFEDYKKSLVECFVTDETGRLLISSEGDHSDDSLSSKNDYDTGMVSPSNSFVELLAKSDDFEDYNKSLVECFVTDETGRLLISSEGDHSDDLLSSKNDYDTGMVSPSNSFVELFAKSGDFEDFKKSLVECFVTDETGRPLISSEGDHSDDSLSSKNDYDTGMVSPSNSFDELFDRAQEKSCPSDAFESENKMSQKEDPDKKLNSIKRSELDSHRSFEACSKSHKQVRFNENVEFQSLMRSDSSDSESDEPCGFIEAMTKKEEHEKLEREITNIKFTRLLLDEEDGQYSEIQLGSINCEAIESPRSEQSEINEDSSIDASVRKEFFIKGDCLYDGNKNLIDQDLSMLNVKTYAECAAHGSSSELEFLMYLKNSNDEPIIKVPTLKSITNNMKTKNLEKEMRELKILSSQSLGEDSSIADTTIESEISFTDQSPSTSCYKTSDIPDLLSPIDVSSPMDEADESDSQSTNASLFSFDLPSTNDVSSPKDEADESDSQSANASLFSSSSNAEALTKNDKKVDESDSLSMNASSISSMSGICTSMQL